MGNQNPAPPPPAPPPTSSGAKLASGLAFHLTAQAEAEQLDNLPEAFARFVDAPPGPQ